MNPGGIDEEVGFPSEIAEFWKRNQGLGGIVRELREFVDSTYLGGRDFSLRGHLLVAFTVWAPIPYQFEEVLCLAANGFGKAAQARVRSMFEHVALAACFVKNPEEAEKFVSFQKVESKKEYERALKLFLGRPDQSILAQIKSKLAELSLVVKDLQEKYGKSFDRNWHKGFRQIAEDLEWEHHFFYHYLLPNRYVHASALIADRSVDESSDGSLQVESGPDYDNADEATRAALTLLVLSLGVALDITGHGNLDRIQKFGTRLGSHYKDKPNRHRI